MEQRNGFLSDVSSFLLVEGSADSEAPDHGIQKLYLDVSTVMSSPYHHGHDDDDAESCTCDTSSTDRTQDVGEGYEMDDQGHCCDCRVADDDHNVNLQYWSSAYEMFSRDAAALEYRNINEKGDQEESTINRSREVMDAMEDWLFWETCMAAGYP